VTPPPTASSGLSTGAIVEIVIGAVLGVVAIGVAVYYILKKRRRNNEASAGMVQTSNTGGNLGPAEMHAENAQEMPSGVVGFKSTAVEIEQPPVELEGLDTGRDKGRKLQYM
jgi:uncharacterized protein HemX